LKPWDIAAGLILVREAGGAITDLDSEADPLASGNVLAANGDLLPELRRLLAGA
jgi:myo-inositol-1(or 4)-monophosphatase